MNFSYDEVHSSWSAIFTNNQSRFSQILETIKEDEIAPTRDDIFKAFTLPREEVKAVIFGQDPYPGVGVADGLAFSSQDGNPIPASLRNIFLEYSSDLGLAMPTSPNLAKWQDAGVLLLNRTLTTSVTNRNAHAKSGWNDFTLEVAKDLGALGVVGILWGNYARELAPHFSNRIESPHPSPLSAYRGFFGSRPFSRTNAILKESGKSEINWEL
jgi:uracil-DNA glycosylase